MRHVLVCPLCGFYFLSLTCSCPSPVPVPHLFLSPPHSTWTSSPCYCVTIVSVLPLVFITLFRFLICSPVFHPGILQRSPVFPCVILCFCLSFCVVILHWHFLGFWFLCFFFVFFWVYSAFSFKARFCSSNPPASLVFWVLTFPSKNMS